MKYIGAVLLLLLNIVSASGSPARFDGKLSPCSISGFHEPALCGDLLVWENRSLKQGRKIPIHVAVLPARGPNPAPDPLFFFEGGPGSAGTNSVAEMAGLLSAVREQRDIVFFDQRGTGRSNPLSCPTQGNKNDMQSYVRDLFPLDALQSCLSELQQKADLRLYVTPIAMEDVEEVRKWLGYERVNLFGISYGTLAAMVYLRQYERHVRSATLMGVAPVNSRAPLLFAKYAQTALDRVFDQCGADPDCREAFPTLREDFRKVVAQLENAPVQTSIPDTQTGKPLKLSLPGNVFDAGLRSLLYGADDYVKVPLYIHLAAEGNFTPIAQHTVKYMKAIDASSIGAYLSITCPEDTLLIEPSEVPDAVSGTFIGDDRIAQQTKACAIWPRGDLPKDHWEPVKSAVPTLILSGFMDPVTPPEEAAEVAKHLPNSAHLVSQDAAHGPFGLKNEECEWKIVSDFIHAGTPYNLDTSCLREMRRMPFVTRLN